MNASKIAWRQDLPRNAQMLGLRLGRDGKTVWTVLIRSPHTGMVLVDRITSAGVTRMPKAPLEFADTPEYKAGLSELVQIALVDWVMND